MLDRGIYHMHKIANAFMAGVVFGFATACIFFAMGWMRISDSHEIRLGFA